MDRINSYPSLNQSCTTTKQNAIPNASITPLVKPCSVVVHKVSADECLKWISMGEIPVNKGNVALKFKKERESSDIKEAYDKSLPKASVSQKWTTKQKTAEKQKDLETNRYFDVNKSGRVGNILPFPLTENPQKRKKSTVSVKYPLQLSDYNFNCSVFIERMDVTEYLVENNPNGQYEMRKQSETLMESKPTVNNKNKGRKMENDFAPGSSRAHLKRESRVRVEDSSKRSAKKIKVKASVPAEKKAEKVAEKKAEKVKYVRKVKNEICGPDFKCGQCQQIVTTDIKLYHHICPGKRERGFVCDICEKIFETIPGLRRHLNLHMSFQREQNKNVFIF